MSSPLLAGTFQVLLGKHLWHIAMLGAWIPIFGAIVLFERVRAHGATTEQGPMTGRPATRVTDRSSPSSTTRATPSAVRASAACQFIALASLCAALVHVAVMPDHFEESVWYGLFFLLASLGQLAFAVSAVVRPTRHLVLAGVVGCAVIIGLWLVSRLVGVPVGPDNGGTEEFGVLDILATSFEVVVVSCGLLILRSWNLRPAWRWSQWPTAFRLAAPLGVAATVMASLLAARS
jgi:hypothetical protein